MLILRWLELVYCKNFFNLKKNFFEAIQNNSKKSLRGVMANRLDWDIELANPNSRHAIKFIFELIPFKRAWTLLFQPDMN